MLDDKINLIDPLLSNDRLLRDNNNTIMWPKESAEQVLFSYEKKENGKLIYDEENRYLKIVSSTSNNNDSTVLDVIDMDDVIGAEIQIEMKTHDTEIRATATTATTKNNEPDSTVTTTRDINEPSDDVLTDTQASATLIIYVYPPKNNVISNSKSLLQKCRITSFQPKPNPNYTRPTNNNNGELNSPRIAFHRTLQLHPMEDLMHVRNIVTAIRALATSTTNTSNTNKDTNKHYLIIVNPKSGPKKNAKQLAETIVVPMLAQANIETTICVTTHYKHAQERVQEKDISTFNGLVLMGGDGIIHEVINGLRSNNNDKTLLSTIPIGVIGCGTANGMATTVTYASNEMYGITQETFLIAKGHTIDTDISQYDIIDQNNNNSIINTYTSFLTFSWAMIAEVDLESEILHYLGELRFDVWAVWRILFLRKYNAKFSYTMDTNTTMISASATDPVPKSWTTIDDDIVLFWASHVTHAGMSSFHSPKSHLQDGVFQIMLIRYKNINKYRLTRILLALETGTHVNLPGVEWITCTQYRLQPNNNNKQSFNDIDGEKVEDGIIHARVIPKAVKFFAKSHQKQTIK